jgi:hypothetical protein
MKNYPFAEARVRRERQKNPAFKRFIEERNSVELTKKRDIVRPLPPSIQNLSPFPSVLPTGPWLMTHL